MALSEGHARFFVSMLWLDLLILSFAVARLSSLFVNESGPFDMFERLRTWCGVLTDFSTGERIVIRPHPRAMLGDILSCVYCFGMWAAMFLWGMYVLIPQTTIFLFVPLAIAHIALIALRKLDG